MAVRQIREMGDDVLTKECRPVCLVTMQQSHSTEIRS